MILDKIKVENFRILRKFEMDLKKELSLVVGKNNSGKTSVLNVMKKMLIDKNNFFDWDDFNLKCQQDFFKKVISTATEEKQWYENEGIRMDLFIKYNREDSYKNIYNFMLDLDDDNNMIVLEFYYHCKFDKMKILKKDFCKDFSGDELKFLNFSKFMKKNIKKYFVLEKYSRKYDAQNKSLLNEKSGPIETRDIEKLININFISANRELSNKDNDHSLSGLSSKYYELRKKREEFDNSELEAAITKADEELNRIYNGREGKSGIFGEVIKSVEVFGAQNDATKISLQSSINEKELLRDNTTLYYGENGNNLPESYNGLGYLNLIGIVLQMETILQKFQGDRKEVSDINLLFIEEPEAHTHPQLQYVFINNIKKLIKKREKESELKLNLQLVVTTHSSHIIADCDFSDIKYIKKGLDQDVICKNFLELEKAYESDNEAFKFIKQYLNLSRAELFFSDKVVFIEGETERILLPAMMKKIDEKNGICDKKLLSQNISIIEVGANSQLFTKLLEFLSLEKVLIITDLDTARLKEAENNKGLRLKGVEAVDANNTTNNSIKAFFELENKDEKNLAILKAKTFEEKEKDGIRICYQTEVNGYQASSFEDSFISENFDFVKNNIENFQKFGEALKNIKKFNIDSGEERNYYDIGRTCIDGKTAFAVGILYYKDDWKIPEYIKEGLEWLQK